KTAEYLAIHPFGQHDGGFILHESRAICRYLAEKYADQGPPLLPRGLQERAVFDQAASVEFANFHPHCQKIPYEAFEKPRRGLPTDQTVVDTAVAALSTILDVYEVILSKHRFLAGDEFTGADLFHLMHAHVFAHGMDLMSKKGRPNVARYGSLFLVSHLLTFL
ncbi:glutathione S-transferase, partial [Mycena latifolia]